METELEKKEILRLSNMESNKITRECLQLALMKLMREKDFDKISITEITKCAGVSRTAFYRNYDSKQAIIEDATQSIFSKLRESLVRYNNHWKAWYILFFNTVKENKESFKIALEAHISIVPISVLDAAFPPATIEWVKYDLEVSKTGLAGLAKLIEAAVKDPVTFEILVAYYKDEEEDLHWGEQQLELIEMIGKQNWLLQQL